MWQFRPLETLSVLIIICLSSLLCVFFHLCACWSRSLVSGRVRACLPRLPWAEVEHHLGQKDFLSIAGNVVQLDISDTRLTSISESLEDIDVLLPVSVYCRVICTSAGCVCVCVLLWTGDNIFFYTWALYILCDHCLLKQEDNGFLQSRTSLHKSKVWEVY